MSWRSVLRQFMLVVPLLFMLLYAAPAQAQSAESCVLPSGGEAHLFLYPTGSLTSGVDAGSCKDPTCSPYVVQSTDPWLLESWFQDGGDSLSMTIENRATYINSSVVLVIAIHGTDTATDFVSITISGGAGGTVTIPYADFTASSPDPLNPFVGRRSHGVYEPSGDAIYAFYDVGPIVGHILSTVTGGVVNLTITAETSGDPNLEIHFDAFDCGTGDTNAFSSDLTWVGPAGCTLDVECPDPIALECVDGGATATLGDPTVSSTCKDPASITFDEAPSYRFQCPGPSTYDVTFAAYADQSSATCTTSVTVVDRLPPSIDCGPQTLVADASCSATAQTPAAKDLCDGVVQTTCTPTTWTGVGPHPMTCSASDCAGNGSTCTATVTIVDATPPTVSCPAPQILECLGPCSTPASVTATGADNCGLAGVSCSPGSGAFCLGSTTSTCTATDASGNSSSCSAVVNVVDTLPPSIVCSGGSVVTTSSNGGACSAVLPVSAQAWDMCEGSLAAGCAPSLLTLGAPGTTASICTAADSSGNAASCSTSLTLVDDTAPSISCPAPQTVLADAQCSATVAIAAAASDNCDGPLPSTCNPSPVVLGAPGAVTSTCSVTDASGNAASCSTSVTMIDVTPPSIVLGAIGGSGPTGTICNDAPVTIPFSVSDNCACAGFAVTADAGTLAFDQGSHTGTVTLVPSALAPSITVHITVTDCSGNSATATASISTRTCFCTYTQGGWGADCKGGNPGCLLAKSFAAVYPSGLTVGDHGSPYDIHFTSASAVNAYLPQGSTPGVLTASLTNPATSPAGVFGGQVTAAHLNVDFDAAGLLPKLDPTPLGSLKVAQGPFAGMTVSDLVLLADRVLGSDTSLLPAGTTVSTLNDALNTVNNSFDNCKASNGYLTR